MDRHEINSKHYYKNAFVVAKKIDDAMRTFNPRVIHVEEGVIKYYSKVPKNFDPSDPSGLLPAKAGVEI
jgi:hypothetical protein